MPESPALTVTINRLRRDWAVLASLFGGVLLTATLVAGAPLYMRSLDRLAFSVALDRQSTRFANIIVFGPHVSLDPEAVEKSDRAIADSMGTHLASATSDVEQFIKTGPMLAGLPSRPLPERDAAGGAVSRGYFQSLSNLEHNVTFIRGRMARDTVIDRQAGPELEVVASAPTAREFGFEIDDLVTLAPSLAHRTRVSARIVGIFEPDDLATEYWRYPKLFLDPAPLLEEPEQGLLIDPREPPVALFVDRGVMAEAVSASFPGTLADPTWFIVIPYERLKGWSIPQVRGRLDGFEKAVSSSLPGSNVSVGGIETLMDDLSRRGFLAKLPILLLLTTIVAVLTLYLAMSSMLIVQRKESELALLRARGAHAQQLLRIYGPEAVVLTVVAVALAPFLAMGAVGLAGVLPAFSEITGGSRLPTELFLAPFAASFAAGLLFLALLAAYSRRLAGADPGARRLSWSRPPEASWFHRNYLDFGLLVFGGLVFWELRARGQIVSGGIFEDAEVNEALLLAPVLFLVVVALMFIRVFPLAMRYVTGDSSAAVHLLVAAVTLILASGLVADEVADADTLGWLGPLALLAGVAAAYAATTLSRRARYKLIGIVLQAALVAAYITIRPLDAEDRLFVPAAGLLSLVPVQVAFLLLAALRRVTPIWLLAGLRRMARNPAQYTWPMTLLLLATGLGAFSATIGATLDRSREHSVRYEVASDIRISLPKGSSETDISGIVESLRDSLDAALISPAWRGTAIVGQTSVQLLAVDSATFPLISWFREDFSAGSLNQLMGALQVSAPAVRVQVPDGSEELGVWIRPAPGSPDLTLWMVLEDGGGNKHTIDLGKLGPPEWRPIRAAIPHGLETPVHLVALQFLERADTIAQRAEFADLLQGTPGTIFLDDIHAVTAGGGDILVLEDFEGDIGWLPIATESDPPDELGATEEDPFRGRRAARFTFGKSVNQVVRGIQMSPTVGPAPAVVSTTFLDASGLRPGDTFVARVSGRVVSLEVKDTAEYFPSMDPAGGGFIVVDTEGLLANLNMLTYGEEVRPNEVFVGSEPGMEDRVLAAVNELANGSAVVRSAASQLQAIRRDPLEGAAWQALAGISLGVVLVASCLGYVAYLLSIGRRYRTEFGLLQAMGLSRSQLALLAGLEHLIILLIGMGLGTWAGLRMGALMVSSLASPWSGPRAVPPIELATNWAQILPVYIAVVLIAGASLVVLDRRSARIDLRDISSLTE